MDEFEAQTRNMQEVFPIMRRGEPTGVYIGAHDPETTRDRWFMDHERTIHTWIMHQQSPVACNTMVCSLPIGEEYHIVVRERQDGRHEVYWVEHDNLSGDDTEEESM